MINLSLSQSEYVDPALWSLLWTTGLWTCVWTFTTDTSGSMTTTRSAVLVFSSSSVRCIIKLVWAKLLCTRKDKNDIYNYYKESVRYLLCQLDVLQLTLEVVGEVAGYKHRGLCRVKNMLTMIMYLHSGHILTTQASVASTSCSTTACYLNDHVFNHVIVNTLIWTYDNHNTGPSSFQYRAVVLVPYCW